MTTNNKQLLKLRVLVGRNAGDNRVGNGAVCWALHTRCWSYLSDEVVCHCLFACTF